MATMTWIGLIGSERTAKKVVDERDGSGNQIFIGRAPVADARDTDDGWWMRRQYFNASNQVTGYRDFQGVWALRSTYLFPEVAELSVNTIRVTGAAVALPIKNRVGVVSSTVRLSCNVTPTRMIPRAVNGRAAVTGFSVVSKNWSTVVTKVRKGYAGASFFAGLVRVDKLKVRKLVGTAQVRAFVAGSLVE